MPSLPAVVVTEAFIEACWRGTPEPVGQLVTIRSDALDEPITVTDWPGGVVSNGVTYEHFPFQLNWASASEDTPFGKGRLTISNVDSRVEEACDAAIDPPALDMAVVRISDPDVVESAIQDARIPAFEGSETKVTATIRPRDFSEEPACAAVATPSSAPGMF